MKLHGVLHLFPDKGLTRRDPLWNSKGDFAIVFNKIVILQPQLF